MDATYTQQNTLPEKDVILTHAFFNGVKDLADDFELPGVGDFEFCCLLSLSNSLEYSRPSLGRCKLPAGDRNGSLPICSDICSHICRPIRSFFLCVYQHH
jgi:hypothetical protein